MATGGSSPKFRMVKRASKGGLTTGPSARCHRGRPSRAPIPDAPRAVYELWSLDDVYALLGLEVDAYDTAPCSLAVQRALRQPLRQVLGWRDLAHWNDHGCPGPAAAEQLLRAAAATAARSCDCSGS